MVAQIPAQIIDDREGEPDGFVVRKGDPGLTDLLGAIDEATRDAKWEKAFAAISKVLEAPTDAMVRRPDGFYVSSRVHTQQMLVALPPAGRDAYRLFNDATARKALEQIDSPDAGDPSTSRIARLQDLFDRYFITSVGDQIADRLGDAKFESGDFVGSARCWGAIGADYPDTSLAASRVLAKRAIALSRAGRWDELQAVKTQLREKYGGEPMRMGGRDVMIGSLLDGSAASPIASAPVTKRAGDVGTPLNLLPKQGTGPSWQMVFLYSDVEDQIRRLTFANSRVSAYNPNSIIPAAVTTPDRIYLNWLGIGIAIDASTGKLVWRSENFSRIATRIQQTVLSGYDSGESSIAISPRGDKLLLVNGAVGPRTVTLQAAGVVMRAAVNGRIVQQPQVVRISARPGSGTISCMGITDGRLLWSSEGDTVPELSSLSILGQPLIVDDVGYVIATSLGLGYQSTDLSLVAVSLSDGKIRWKMSLGALGMGGNVRGLITAPKPLLTRVGDRLYILTGNGALLAVDLPGQRIEWVFTHETFPMLASRVPGMYRGSEPELFGASMRLSGSMLYFKEKGSNILYALDTSGPSLKWKRPVDRDASVASADSSLIYLLGDELTAIDLMTREMRWSARTPLGSRQFQPFVEGSRAYVFGSKGIYGVDLQGGTMETFTSDEANGGAVMRLGDRLICISSRSVTAYPIPPAASERP
jgi:outer membrane protein assembly factor BamB